MNEKANQEMMAVQTRVMPLAVAPMDSNAEILSEAIEKSFATVYAEVESGKIRQHGHNVIVYRQFGGEIEIECGVQVMGPFVGLKSVVYREIPAVRAATTRHRGEYGGLGETHAALLAWSRTHGLSPTGLRWEVYGDWNEDLNALYVDIFHQVAEEALK